MDKLTVSFAVDLELDYNSFTGKTPSDVAYSLQDELDDLLFEAGQNVVGVFTSFVCIAFSLVFLFSFVEFMSASWDVPSPALQMPNLLFFFGAFLGILMFLLTSLEKLIYDLGKRAGESVK